MSLVLITSERFEEHEPPPGHPESPRRAEVMQAVAAGWRKRGGGEVIEPRAVTREELLRVHSAEYVDLIGKTSGRAVMLDPDTYTSPESFEIARLAAGAAVVAVERALAADRSRAFALVRPPGHHAERDRAMGFCLFSNAAVAAAHARAAGAQRVAVVDYDVHHGNGTQWIFYEDPRVLYVSTHQFPFYPGTGDADQAGKGAGEGFTFNVPLAAGATDADYDLAFSGAIVPVLRQFAPDLLIVSAGFDAHERDPLAGMRLSAEGFARLTARLVRLADETCRGRMALVTEGGYELGALAECLELTIATLEARHDPLAAKAQGSTARAEAALEAVRAVHAKYWKL